MLRKGIDGEESFWDLVKAGRYPDALEVLGSAPWLWIVVAVCPVVAGAAASFWPERIKDGYLPALLPGSKFDWPPTVFWLAIALTGASFGLTQWSQGRAGESLRSMVRRLQTLPPSGFLKTYQKAFGLVADQALLVMVKPDASQQEIEHAIRNVLGMIIELARDFDENGEAVYGANLMVWRPAGEPFESKSPLHLVPYVAGDPAVLGHLELVEDLSTNTLLKAQKYSKDPHIKPVVLPVPVDTAKVLDSNSHSRDPVLPGAPQAFVTGDFVAFESVDSFIQWLNDHSSRGLEVTEPLKEYFLKGEGRSVRSFGSRPIEGVGPMKKQVVAVLNIHSGTQNLLQDSGQTLFAPLIEPFCVLLATLLQQREVLPSTSGSGPSPAVGGGASGSST